MNLLKLFASILVVASCLVGCGDDDADDDGYYYYYDDAALTTAYWEDWATVPVYATTDPFEDPYFYDDALYLTISEEAPIGDPDAAAVIVADNQPQYFTPAGCVSSERDGSELTLTLDECVGPFGASVIDGMLRLSFSDDDGQIAFELASEDLTIDDVSAELSAEGVYSSMDGMKTVRYTSRRTLTGQRRFSGEFDSIVSWDAGSNCVTRDASGSATTDDRSFDAEIEGYTRCAGECPSSGVITVSDDRGTAVLTYDGTDRARLERPDGSVDSLRLACD